MATISNELFLYVCVQHSNSGKIDFKEVENACGIKQNAAYMRWSRFVNKLDKSTLTKANETGANDTEQDGNDQMDETPSKPPKKPVSKKRATKGSAKKPAAKKRKLEDEEGERLETNEIKKENDGDED